jgi:hypothetical protein
MRLDEVWGVLLSEGLRQLPLLFRLSLRGKDQDVLRDGLGNMRSGGSLSPMLASR